MRFQKSKKFLFGPAARRFIGGETMNEALETLRRLKQEGLMTTLDFLGESVTTREEAQNATLEYIGNLRTLKNAGLDRNISIKLTQIGLDIDAAFARDNLLRIAKVASDVGGFVRVDMEGSAHTLLTLRLVEEAHKQYPQLGVAVQSMLRRTPEDVVALIQSGVGMRLVKGAYKEPPSIAFRDKREVNRQCVALMKRLLISGGYHAIATHDEKIIEETRQFARQQNIPPESFEFQMLLGIRGRLARQLVAEGWRVRLYVPYGRFWLHYMTRRLRERKENVWFVLRHLFARAG